MLQRIALALVLSLEPDYLLADEPTSALDSVNKQLLIEALKAIKHRVGLLLVSHDAVVLEEICEEVLTLSHGEIVENGNMESVLDQSREIKEFLWMDC